MAKPATSWKWKFIWTTWVVSLAVALVSMTIFVQGILRDSRAGEPVLRMDLAAATDWIVVPFRAWRPGTYRLFISSVNHDPKFVGAPFAGEFEVAIIAPDGSVFFRRVYPAASTGHVLPDNYGDSQLGVFRIDGRPLQKWSLRARVLKPDSRFVTARTEVKLWRNRVDPGMGGLINYVMIIPAGIFLVLAFTTSLALAAKGSKWPLWVTVFSGMVFLVALPWSGDVGG